MPVKTADANQAFRSDKLTEKRLSEPSAERLLSIHKAVESEIMQVSVTQGSNKSGSIDRLDQSVRKDTQGSYGTAGSGSKAGKAGK